MEQSQLISEIKNMQYLNCEKHTECDLPLNLVCIKQECERQFFLDCNDCILENHSQLEHKTSDIINFKRLFNKIKSVSQQNLKCQQYTQNLQPMIQQTILLKKEFQIQVDALQERIDNIFETIIQYIGNENDYIKKQQDQIQELKVISNDILQKNKKEEIDQMLQKLKQIIEISYKNSDFQIDLQSMQSEQAQATKTIQKKQQDCTNAFSALGIIQTQVKKLNDQLGNIKYQHLQEDIQKPKFNFSQTLKDEAIQILSDVQVVKKQSCDQSVFSLMTKALSMKNDTSWIIQITNKIHWLAVGVCHPDIIKSNKYKFIFDKIGYGYYLISQEGYKWSHTNQNEHSEPGSFTYDTGDKIYIQFSPERKKIYFSKNKSQPYIELQLDPYRNDFQPCVVLCQSEESVEVMQNDDFHFEF